MSDTRERFTLARIAGADWRIRVDPTDLTEQTIERPNPTLRGAYVGPLLTGHVGCTVLGTDEDEEAGEVLDLDAEDAAILYAAAAIPAMAEVVTWALEALSLLPGIHFDRSNMAGDFHCNLRDKLKRIVAMVDERPETLGPGTHAMR